MILAAIALAVLGALQHMGGEVLQHLATVTSVSAGSGESVVMAAKVKTTPVQFGRIIEDSSEPAEASKVMDSARSIRLARVNADEGSSSSFAASASSDSDQEQAAPERISPGSGPTEVQNGHVYTVTMLCALIFAMLSLYLASGNGLRSRVPR